MADQNKALQTQLSNIEKKTGKPLAELLTFIQSSSDIKYSELRKLVQDKFELGYGDANMLLQVAKQPAQPVSESEVLDNIYTGKKAELRGLHDATMTWLHKLGEFEIAPKKTYLSLRRKKQFMMVGPGSKGRLELGLNAKALTPTDRLEALAPGKMCQYRVYLSDASELDATLKKWVKAAYESAG